MREINNNKDMRNINFLFGNPLHLFRKVLVMFMLLMIVGVGNVLGTTVTFQHDGIDTWSQKGTSGTGGALSITKSNITVSSSKGYTDPSNTDIKIYAGGTMTISCPSQYKITAFSVTIYSSGNGQDFAEENGYDWGEWASVDGTKSFTLRNNSDKQVQWSSLSVTYEPEEAAIVVTDAISNVYDNDHGYDFGSVGTTSGSVTLHVEGICIYKAYPGSYDYYMQLYPSGDDDSNFRVNGVTSADINSTSTNITLSYTGLSANKTYETTLVGWAYKSSDCRTYVDETVNIAIPISVTYAAGPAASSSPASWDFGNVEVGETVTKTFTITTANLTGNLTVGMYLGGQGMSTTTNSIAQAATSTDVTVSFTPASTGLKEDLLTISGGGLAASLDISITGTGVEMHDIHWIVNGSDWSLNPSAHGYPTTKVVDGTKPSVMPTTPIAGEDGCGSKFMGWTTAPIEGSRGNAPTPCWNSLTYFQNVTSETSYYAVFADEQP